MEIGFISDIHGNAIALKAVLADMQSVDEIVCLGDVIGYGPRPAACVELVRNHASTVLQGNHEMFLSQPERCAGNRLAFAGINHAWDELSEDQKNWAASLKKQTRLFDGDVWIAHGHPDSQTPFKPVTEENVRDLTPYLRESEAEVLAIGHVHVQYKQDLTTFEANSGLVFNPGSVGQPRDGDPRAAYAVFDTETMSVSLYRVDYDVQTVVEQIHDVGLPEEAATCLEHGELT